MNWSAIFGTGLAAAALVLGMVYGGPLIVFIDLVSILIVVFPVFFMVMAAHGASDFRTHGLGGLRRFFMPGSGPAWGPDDSLKAARIANTATSVAIAIGAVGTLIGTIQMLQNLEDPAAIGPALAVAGLTIIYALILIAVVFMPLARFHTAAAMKTGGTLQAADQDLPLINVMVILALIGLSVGMSFTLMLLAMGV